MGNTTCKVDSTENFPPSWEILGEAAKRVSPSPKEPVLTFYRDSNGWCPFCERVWIALELKGIPYTERLIKLIDRPAWFKDIVPTNAVPAIVIYDDEQDKRSVYWESQTILKKLDELYPETVQLMNEEYPNYKEGVEMIERLKKVGEDHAGFPPATSIKKEDFELKKKIFEETLDEFDAFIKSNGGPFILGAEVTGIDVLITSFMERWIYQLPITVGMNILEGRPNIQNWYQKGMGLLPAYVNRVSGDKYSWTGVLYFLLTQFGEKNKDGTDAQQIKETKEKVNQACLDIAETFAKEKEGWTIEQGCTLGTPEVARLAAVKILSNYSLIVEDCTYDKKPNTQTHIKRANSQKNADVALRAVVSILLRMTEKEEIIVPRFDLKEDADDAVQAMRTISSRLCVPRDMGAPSAQILRSVLTKVADTIEESN